MEAGHPFMCMHRQKAKPLFMGRSSAHDEMGSSNAMLHLKQHMTGSACMQGP